MSLLEELTKTESQRPFSENDTRPITIDNKRYYRIMFHPIDYRRMLLCGSEPELDGYLVESQPGKPFEDLMPVHEYTEHVARVLGYTRAEITPMVVMLVSERGQGVYSQLRAEYTQASLHLHQGLDVATFGECLYPSIFIPKEVESR